MIEAIKNKFVPVSTETQFAENEKALQAARKALGETEQDYDRACRDLVENAPGANSALEQAKEKRARLEAQIRGLSSKGKQLTAKLAAELAERKKEQIEERRKKGRELVDRRMKLAAELEREAENIVRKEKEIRDLTQDLIANGTDPGVWANTPLDVSTLHDAFRMYLKKLGWEWAHSWPWGSHGIPTYQSQISESNTYYLVRCQDFENAP